MSNILIPVLSTDMVFLFKIASELKLKQHNVDFIVPDNPYLINSLRTISQNEFTIHIVDSSVCDSLDILSEVNKFEKKYQVTFWDFTFSDRTYNPNKSIDVLGKEFVSTFILCERIIQDCNFDFILQHVGGEILRRVLQKVGYQNGCLNIWIGFSPLKNHFTLYTNEYERIDNISLKELSDLTEVDISLANQYLSEFKESESMMLYYKEHKKNQIASNNYPPDSINVIMAQWKMANKRFSKAICFICKKINKNINLYLKKGFCKIFLYPSIKKSDKMLMEKKYIFFPLQLRLESRITVRASHFYNPDFLIEILSRNVPLGYCILVKDHPEWVANLPLFSLIRVAKCNNVMFINPKLNSHKVIKSSQAVVLINNTAGFESILYNKPVITFGDSFYSGLGITHDIRDLSKCSEVILNAVDNPISDTTVIKFLSALFKVSYPGKYDFIDDFNINLFIEAITLFIKDKSGVG